MNGLGVQRTRFPRRSSGGYPVSEQPAVAEKLHGPGRVVGAAVGQPGQIAEKGVEPSVLLPQFLPRGFHRPEVTRENDVQNRPVTRTKNQPFTVWKRMKRSG